MTEHKHTPGPWNWVQDEEGAAMLLTGGVDDIVLGSPWADYIEVTDANARLIAAAPELLAALEAIAKAEWMVTHDWGGDRDVVLAQARAAIAKAKGEK